MAHIIIACDLPLSTTISYIYHCQPPSSALFSTSSSFVTLGARSCPGRLCQLSQRYSAGQAVGRSSFPDALVCLQEATYSHVGNGSVPSAKILANHAKCKTVFLAGLTFACDFEAKRLRCHWWSSCWESWLHNEISFLTLIILRILNLDTCDPSESSPHPGDVWSSTNWLNLGPSVCHIARWLLSTDDQTWWAIYEPVCGFRHFLMVPQYLGMVGW